MYSPKIYESQIPSLYHAAHSLGVPMTQLANAFVYHGLAGGFYGMESAQHLPKPYDILPENTVAKLPIFEASSYSPRDYMMSTPPIGNLMPYISEFSKEVASDR